MDKRLINSINGNIEKLSKRIVAAQAEIIVMKNQHDKFIEMLDLIAPKSTQETKVPPGEETVIHAPKEGDTGEKMPHFLGKKHGDKGEPA